MNRGLERGQQTAPRVGHYLNYHRTSAAPLGNAVTLLCSPRGVGGVVGGVRGVEVQHYHHHYNNDHTIRATTTYTIKINTTAIYITITIA